MSPRAHRAGLSVEQQERIIDLYSQRGASLRTVAEQIPCHLMTVHKVLVENDVPRRRLGGSRPTLTNEDLLHVGELYALGWSQAMIAAELGITRTTVRYRLDRLGGRRRSRAESARLMYAQGRHELAGFCARDLRRSEVGEGSRA